MRAKNVLVFMSDEHNPKTLGCYGHDMVQTPNLDRLAARGTRFSAAYTNSPICVPARASFATGRYVHQIRYWDNAMPYEGRIPSWGHRLMAAGHQVVSVGKLHYRTEKDPVGFSEELVPMHVIDGIGDLSGMIREDAPVRKRARKYIEEAGEGDSTYQRYDDDIARQASRWLREEAPRYTDKPWVLFISFVCPHFPLLSRPEYFRRYPMDAVPWPVGNENGRAPDHPGIEDYWRFNDYDTPFSERETRRAIAAYFGMVTFMDEKVGEVMRTLEECGLGEETRVLYTSDHGDNLGRNGLYGKSTMYEDSAGVPLIIAGEDIPAGRVVNEPVSLVDFYPTIVKAAGEPLNGGDRELPGTSLFAMANGEAPQRTVLSEYHATCSRAGIFAIRKEQYKYVHYIRYRPQLFDLQADPDEMHDLAGDPAYREVLASCEQDLRRVVDPEHAEGVAKHDQAQRVFEFGGPERILGMGTLGYTPAPGEQPDRG